MAKKTKAAIPKREVVTKVKKPLKRSARAEVQEPLPLEPKPAPATAVTAADMERWHKELARVAGRLALTLARRRRPPDLIDDIVNTLAPVLEEARVRQ